MDNLLGSPRGTRASTTTTTTTTTPTNTSVILPLIRRPDQPPPAPLVITPKPKPPKGILEKKIPIEIAQDEYIAENMRRREAREAQRLPPTNILPRRFADIPKPADKDWMQLPSSGVGLLRRLSLYSSYLAQTYNALDRRAHPSLDWETNIGYLFGTVSKDDFIGAGTRGTLPGHDQLGLFPLFQDHQGRQYFEGFSGTAETPGLNRNGMINLALRIPRVDTRKRGEIFQYPMFFPTPGELVKLKLCTVPFFPFYWSKMKRRIESIVEEYSGKLLIDRVKRLETLNLLYNQTIIGIVRGVYENRHATCTVEIEIPPDQQLLFSDVFIPAQIMREEWNLNITDLITEMASSGMNVIEAIEFFMYLNTNWIPHMVAWTAGPRKKNP